MTTVSPAEVWYEYEAWITHEPLIGNLPVSSIVASMDRDRVAFCMATMVCEWLTDEQWALIDPRQSEPAAEISFRVYQYTGDPDAPTQVGRLPVNAGLLDVLPIRLFVRNAERNWVDRTVTIELAGGESMLQDKTRNSATTVDTGATTVGELFFWHMARVFDSWSSEYTGVEIEPIPAGDRRLMLQKENHFEAFKTELDAVGARVLDEWGVIWKMPLRDTVTGTVRLATFEGVAGTDPIVYDCREVVSRDGDWADGVLIEYKQPDGTTAYQVSDGGANTRGLVLSRDRSKPAQNAAQQIKTRTVTRGYDLEVVARCRFDIYAYDQLEVHTPEGVVSAHVRSIEWDIAASQMTIRAQKGNPEE